MRPLAEPDRRSGERGVDTVGGHRLGRGSRLRWFGLSEDIAVAVSLFVREDPDCVSSQVLYGAGGPLN